MPPQSRRMLPQRWSSVTLQLSRARGFRLYSDFYRGSSFQHPLVGLCVTLNSVISFKNNKSQATERMEN